MPILSADLHQAIFALWNSTGLNASFRSFWSPGKTNDYPVLHDQQAGPASPMPYCIFNQEAGDTSVKMSGRLQNKTKRQEIHDIPIEFVIFARSLTTGRTAKDIAATMAEEVIKIFGGHPEIEPRQIELTSGSCLQSTYQSDWGMREDETNYSWHIKYVLKLDVPVAA